MNNNHHLHRDTGQSKKALKLAILATSFILIVEVAGGIWTNSLALLSDAGHVFMDLLSFLISFAAIKLAEQPISDTHTFGWHRLEVFAALINGFTIFFIAFVILIHAFKRFFQPQAILGPEMLGIAIFGLVVNLFVLWRLYPHIGDDVNTRSAFVHAFGDAAASVAVIVGGFLVIMTGKHIFDPLTAMFIAVMIVFGVYKIFRDSIQILLEGVPVGLNQNTVVQSIEDIAGKNSIKDLHVWNICSHICALTVHLSLSDQKMPEQKHILEDIGTCLEKKFNIMHSTIQIESQLWKK
jgi:cobalt-zinc-cadmium efflux system protein